MIIINNPLTFLNLSKTTSRTYESREEGAIYVSNADLSGYEKPDINYEYLRNLKGNHFADSAVKQVSNLLFNERFKVTVLNESNETDQKHTEIVSSMCKNAGIWNAMKTSFEDKNFYGASLFNPVWAWDGPVYKLIKLNHLPSDSFGPAVDEDFDVYGSILKGIVYDVDKKLIRYFQSYETEVNELKNVFMITDPNSPDIAGVPKLVPIVPLISQINFCIKAQMQKVHRVGAPIMFIKIHKKDENGVTIGKPDDKTYAKKILANWGKDTQYLLRENMELVPLDFNDSETALDTINLLSKLIMESNSPTRLMNKGGEKALISGDSMAQISLIQNWLRGEKTNLENDFERLLQPYITANNLTGYKIKITIPDFEIDKSELNLAQAEAGFKTRSLRINEIRKLLGHPELDENDLALLKDEYSALANEVGIGNLLSTQVKKSDYNSRKKLQNSIIEELNERGINIYEALLELEE